MKALKIPVFALTAVLLLAFCAVAQSKAPRTITNTQLEKYRDARVKADEEYRQTYAQRGMPSPEELEKIEEDRQKRLTELSLKLREERMQKEFFDAYRRVNSSPDVIYVQNGGYVAPSVGYYQFGFGRSGGHKGIRFRPYSNVEMVKQQASMFPSAIDMIREHSGDSHGNFFRGGFRTGRRR